MYIIKVHYAEFGVSYLFFSKVIEEKPLGGRLDPPHPGKGRVKTKVMTLRDHGNETLHKGETASGPPSLV